MIRLLYILSFSFIITLLMNNCAPTLEPITIPNYKENLSKKSKLIPNNKLKLLEGVYEVTKGGVKFGKYAIIMQLKDGITFFFRDNISYALTICGELDNNILIEGFWRFAENSSIGGLSLAINQSEGAKEILDGKESKEIIINGTYEELGEKKPISLKFIRNLPKIDKYIIAHRAGGRNQDRLPASENSVEIIKYCEYLGVNSIEIDVRLTKDSIPVLYHDEYLNKRLINEEYFLGKISDYYFKQLKSFCTLKNGERIPSLEEALETVLNETNLKLVWLDIKSPEAISIVAKIQKKYNDLAKSKGRKLEIILGLPDEEIMESYKNLKDKCNYPSLLELDFNNNVLDCFNYWAPRWTLGLNTINVDYIHSLNRKAFVWTLDMPEFIYTFVKDGKFDGILTNYPTQVVYEYYFQN